MQRYIIITIFLTGLLTSYASPSTGDEMSSFEAHLVQDSQERCEDNETPKRVNFTKPDVIKKMKPFIIKESKNIKTPLIQKAAL